MTAKKRTAILISGRGSNMAALIEAARASDYPAEIVGVFSSRPDAPGLQTAADAGLPTETLAPADYPDRPSFDASMQEILEGWDAELVCLAGYMRLLSDRFVVGWPGRILNIHPSLLPAFKGLNVHDRVLEASVPITGATVHFVTPELDAGPPIIQAAVPVVAGDSPDTLAARVLKAEHLIYPKALEWLAAGKVRLEGGKVVRDGAMGAPPPPLFWPPLGA